MKGKIKVLKTLFFMLFITTICFMTSEVKAATNLAENELIKINNKTITKTTTISQINSMLGNYKIETDSAFGGKMYSYYDDTYTWYLGIETDASGNIKGYGAVGGNFKAKRFAYGDMDDYTYWYLSGTVLAEWEGDIYGMYEYNCSRNDVTAYWQNYQSASDKYLYGLQKHSAVVSKVLAVKNGYEFPQTAPCEDIFYMNEQLKSNGSSFYEYAVDHSQTKAIMQVSSRTDNFYDDLPNPLRLGYMTDGYEYAQAYKYVLYDIDMTDYTNSNGYTRMYYINPDFLAERATIELTNEEKEKLLAVREQYTLYNQYGNAIKEMYDTSPSYQSLPLVAGKYSQDALLTATAFLNMARVGIGMNAVELDSDIADAAQHKAVLIRYMNETGMSASNWHLPSKPDGVSQDFYNKAQSYMNENLYMGSIQSSISNALNDGYGDPVVCGHRYNLLEPSYTKWGTGSVGGQGVHKFGGTTSVQTELVAWPSNGIFPIEVAGNSIGNWTAQFYKNYTVSSATEVSIKCLNTGTTYEITNANKNQSGKLLKVTGTSLLTFRDDNISYQNGDVFEVTLKNVKNSNNQTTDYKYRIVFTSLSQLSTVEVTDIILGTTDLTLSVGKSRRITTMIAPEALTSKIIKYTSLNEDIVTVRQDGVITALKPGTTQIKVSCDNIEKTVNITVEEVSKGDINKDGLVDSADAAILLNIFKYNTATQEDLKIGDLDGNGMIDSADAAMVLNLFKYGN